MHGGVLIPLAMSTVAGLSTCIGSFIALFAKNTNTKFLSFALGFSAGVMILVSFCELMPESREGLSGTAAGGGIASAACMLAGLFAAAAIDRAVPRMETPVRARPGCAQDGAALARMGLVTALALTLHNFPEGIATFMAGYSDVRIGLPVMISIAMHNIPEGVAVSVPVYFGTGSRARAFAASALSGLSEPLGALLAFALLAPFLSAAVLGVIFGVVAGIMVYLSFDELIPASEQFGSAGLSAAGILSGVVFMWTALSFF